MLWSTGSKRAGSRRAGSVVVAHGLSCSAACRNLPGPGLKPVSPALTGRFLTTVPPGKSVWALFELQAVTALELVDGLILPK